MGYDVGKIEVTYRVSRHNSEQDKIDDLTAERLYLEIAELVKESRYDNLRVMVYR